MAPRSRTRLERVKPEAYPLLSLEAVGALKRVWRQVRSGEQSDQAGAWDDVAIRLVALVAQEVPAWREVTGEAMAGLVGHLASSAGGSGHCGRLAHGLMLATLVSGDSRYQEPHPVACAGDAPVWRTCEQLIATFGQGCPPGLGAGTLAAHLFDQLYETAYSAGLDITEPDGPERLFAALDLAGLDPARSLHSYETVCLAYGAQEPDGWRLALPAAGGGGAAGNEPEALAVALALAHELHDVDRLLGIRQWFEAHCGPTTEGDEFFYTFGAGPVCPRDVANLWAAMAHVGEAGAIRRMYNEPDVDKFSEPTVSEVDYPEVAVRQAYYDREKDALVVGIATGAGRPGASTSFRVSNLEVGGDHEVIADGAPSPHWKHARAGEIVVETTVGDHTFVVR